MFRAHLITKASPSTGYAISSSLQSTKSGISSLSDSTYLLSEILLHKALVGKYCQDIDVAEDLTQ
jgi:hypothetical protein